MRTCAKEVQQRRMKIDVVDFKRMFINQNTTCNANIHNAVYYIVCVPS